MLVTDLRAVIVVQVHGNQPVAEAGKGVLVMREGVRVAAVEAEAHARRRNVRVEIFVIVEEPRVFPREVDLVFFRFVRHAPRARRARCVGRRGFEFLRRVQHKARHLVLAAKADDVAQTFFVLRASGRVAPEIRRVSGGGVHGVHAQPCAQRRVKYLLGRRGFRRFLAPGDHD